MVVAGDAPMRQVVDQRQQGGGPGTADYSGTDVHAALDAVVSVPKPVPIGDGQRPPPVAQPGHDGGPAGSQEGDKCPVELSMPWGETSRATNPQPSPAVQVNHL